MAIIDAYDRGWGINPTGIAYIQDERPYTFDEVGELSCRIANRLLALGLPKETKGAIWAGNDVTSTAGYILAISVTLMIRATCTLRIAKKT